MQVHGRRAAHAGPTWAEGVQGARTVRWKDGELSTAEGWLCRREKRRPEKKRERKKKGRGGEIGRGPGLCEKRKKK